MPAQKKPADRLQRRNKPKERDAQVVAINTEKVPKAPAVCKALKSEWTALWKSELAANYTESDLPGLRRLFVLRDRQATFEEDAFAEGAVTRGSTGQQTMHPLFKQADVYQSQILALEDRFGLNPQSRLKLGIALGEAHRSLDDMNKRIAEKHGGGAASERSDPRLTVIDTTGA